MTGTMGFFGSMTPSMGNSFRVFRRYVWYRLNRWIDLIWWPVWFLRFRLRRRPSAHPLSLDTHLRLEDIPVLFINLEDRKDRRDSIEAELKSFGFIKSFRIDAIAHRKGIIGCSKSHRIALQESLNFAGPVLICEDDLEFTATPEQLASVVEEFIGDPRLDVLAITNNVGDIPVQISESLSITLNTQTAACYLVKPNAKRLLEANFKNAVAHMERGWSEKLFAHDVYWKRLQRAKLFFAIPNKRLGKQRASHSDIQNKWMDYGL